MGSTFLLPTDKLAISNGWIGTSREGKKGQVSRKMKRLYRYPHGNFSISMEYKELHHVPKSYHRSQVSYLVDERAKRLGASTRWTRYDNAVSG